MRAIFRDPFQGTNAEFPQNGCKPSLSGIRLCGQDETRNYQFELRSWKVLNNLRPAGAWLVYAPQ
jgi:hypothetical protein